ncbi:BrnT family toxin [Serratia ureilytica]
MFILNGIRIKNHSNQRKHRVSFEIGATGFSGSQPFGRAGKDWRMEKNAGKRRHGRLRLLLLVAHTTTETDVEGDVEIVRIISARKADAKERGKI